MTKEKAIALLNNLRAFAEDDDEPAIDLAIEALSADAVSREDTVTLNSPISIQAEMVAVVRCKDCIYHETCNLSSSHWWKGGYTVDIEFCSFGERREE